MISRLIFMDTDNTYPYKNLAMEEYMTEQVPQGTCILFLWQNRRTVVIGRNQNCWKECNVKLLEEDGGYLVRRLSGGGAVYHDLGNLNFTFVVSRQDYDVDRQLEVILQAVRILGIDARKTGRNDITVEERKFSGNAFYRTGDGCYHHGTLLMDVDKEQMSRYLNVSQQKLAAKGVASVRSRVANLKEYCPDLTVDRMKMALFEAFGQVYGMEPERVGTEILPAGEIERLTEKFESWNWKYGRKIPFEYEMEKRFAWGDVQIRLHVNEGRIREAEIFSDAMAQEIIGMICRALAGCLYEEKDMCRAVAETGAGTANPQEEDQIRQDIITLIRESM